MFYLTCLKRIIITHPEKKNHQGCCPNEFGSETKTTVRMILKLYEVTPANYLLVTWMSLGSISNIY